MGKKSDKHPLERRGYINYGKHPIYISAILWQKSEDGVCFNINDYTGTHIRGHRLGYEFGTIYEIKSPRGVYANVKFYSGFLERGQLRDLPKLEKAAKRVFKLLRGKKE